MSSAYRVSRAARIDAPPSAVYPHLEDLRRWLPWSPWEGHDPYTVRTWSGREHGAGAGYSWNGNRETGEGSVWILAAEPDRRLDLELTFVRPFPAESTLRLDLDPESDGAACVVTMTMAGSLRPLLRALRRFMPLDAMLAKDLERGLAKLTEVVEEEHASALPAPAPVPGLPGHDGWERELREGEALDALPVGSGGTAPEEDRDDVSPVKQRSTAVGEVARSA